MRHTKQRTGTAWTRTQVLTIVATGLGLFMVFLDALIANVALPDIQRDFGVGESGLQWVVAAYSIGMAVFIMAGATAADRFGRRRLYVAGVSVFTLASAAAGLAPGLLPMAVARAVQGIGAATVTVTSLALVSAAFPDDDERAKAIGLWTGVASVATALGPTVGGVLTESISWRAVFMVNVPVGALVLVLTLRHVAESRQETARGFDWPGQALFVVAVGSLAYGLIQGQKAGWTSSGILTLLAVGVVGLVVFARYEYRNPHPMMDVRLFRNRAYAVGIATIFSAFFSAYGMLLVVTQYFQNVEAYSPASAGLLILPFAFNIMLLSPIAGRLAARFGPLPVARSGQPLLVAGLTVIALGMPVSVAVVAAGLFLCGAGVALLVTPVTALAMNAVPVDRAGMASGIMSAQRAIGSTFGFAVLGSILAVWLGRTLGADLRQAVPDATARRAIADRIVQEANPYAYAAEIGPGRPLPGASPEQQHAIVEAATRDFIQGCQMSVGVAAALCAVTMVLLWTVAGGGTESRAAR
ncbi:DHA2 family efflux MFS transporter permease subunit [Streptomyces tirandamycinicus]|uniref:DHA2 family efflux MFS transporter permease subunit n=1 Tax=Streptomyces TaxID=1883 RepID=UPI00147E5BC2|nr:MULTISPECIES: DHA2 family efflux MFS transporter permease subunit [Streptomyces]MCY0983935.1 DHA2 family efflux MFS transporter permease subunit [Streptomyces tirandamycinicus]